MDSTTLRLSWAPPLLASQNGIITEYVVNVSVMDTGERFQHRVQGPASSLTLASLHPDYIYTYTVSSSTAVGVGPFSSAGSIRMPEDG